MTVGNIVRILACISLVLGGIECFAGLKLMKPMVIVWSFFGGLSLGFLAGVGIGHVIVGIIFALLLGSALAALAIMQRKIATCVVVAFMAATTMYVLFNNICFAVLAGIPFGVLSFFCPKVTSFVVTAVSGAGIILLSAYTIFAIPFNQDVAVMVVLWIPMALAGMGCQYITTHTIGTVYTNTGGKSTTSSGQIKVTKYLGMQKAYRNYCIKCGARMMVTSNICSECGFNFED
ncbi:MAG: hypothetical protein E7395_02240 [Ruminococcaceae bacterium]|nr:hypothetical protein [Oscillospiraceae bacterium]